MATLISSWSPDKKHTEIERWVCIYPAYINSKKTLAEGRRLPRSQCVENPTHQEIRDVLASTGLRVGVENKIYSRERSKFPILSPNFSPCPPLKLQFVKTTRVMSIPRALVALTGVNSKEMLYRGRIRVQLKNDDGSPLNPDYPTRESVMRYITKTIPNLKSRQNRPADQPAQSSNQSSNRNKGGKKGRR